MNRETFLESFDHIADAPGGIDKLRTMILDLAMRGALTSRVDEGTTTAELLAQIDVVREAKIAARYMRRPKSVEDPSPDQEPHPIPAEWRWVRVSRIAHVVGGGTPSAGNPSNFAEPGIPWITPADMARGKVRVISRGSRGLSPQGLATSSAALLPPGSLVFSSRAPIGYVAVVENELATNQGFKSLVPFAMECSPFLYWALRAFSGAIASLGSGTTFKEVSGSVMESVVLPLPPLSEQRVVVERIEQLMDLCDDLEQQQAARTEGRSALTASTLYRLTAAESVTDLRNAVRSFAENIGLHLSPGEGDLAALRRVRQTILDLAVRGRLTRQDPDDEPASRLVKRVNASREELARRRGRQRSAPSGLAGSAGVPFSLPDSWQWSRLGDVSDSRLGKMLDERKNTGVLRPYLRNANVQWGRFDLNDIKQIRLEEDELEEYSLRDGDLLVVEGGDPARCAIWDNSLADGAMVFQKALHRVRPGDGVSARYIAFVLKNGVDSGRIAELFTGSTIKHLTGEKLKDLLVPLPPTAEQNRIVNRVTELFALCDELEDQLARAGDLRRNVAASVVAHATSAAGPYAHASFAA